MNSTSSKILQLFNSNIGVKFQLYNSLFTSLPFHRVEKTGMLLSILLSNCEDGYKNKLNPTEIVNSFFEKNTKLIEEKDKLDMLFRMIQYVERQVVLFDALEDAAFTNVRDIAGIGSLKQLEMEVQKNNQENELEKKLQEFSLQLVLTAHPTQFYPGAVLGIINDLANAIKENNISKINMYLQQLGKTPFLQKQKPTPYDEAISLIWYLENVFYTAIGKITSFITSQFTTTKNPKLSIINVGFWPGGDRDGNPFVTAGITLKVANALRSSIIKCYYIEIREIKRRLTFKGVDTILNNIEKQLYEDIFTTGVQNNLTKPFLIEELEKIKELIIYHHNSLFLYLINDLINKIEVFGLHFASLDIRQDSSVHSYATEYLYKEKYATLNVEEKIKFICNINAEDIDQKIEDELVNDTIVNIKNIQKIQLQNGQAGCNRYIISQCKSALQVLEVYGLFLYSGWKKEDLNIDIVPLFETIEDLQEAAIIMQQLYNNNIYKTHLQLRNNRQTIMLGFSDGTKDGGYLMANFSIYKAKEALTAISKEYNIDVVFFDGRGGPPARGGGKTHQFYASMGSTISTKEIQLTIQGQTISSNFGTIESAQYNIEQLIHAGISNGLNKNNINLLEQEKLIFEQLALKSYEAYKELKNHPDFLNYLTQISPVKYYNETNIASRPSKRNGSTAFLFKDLRAIPYVGAWAQIKQNVTGFYGVGTALESLKLEGKFSIAKDLYKQSLFFKTLLDNSEMALKKCFFPLTEYLSTDKKYGEIWNKIYAEYELTKKNILQLSGKNELMNDYPIDSLSITMREKIVLPLITIQQFAINKIRTMDEQFIENPIKDVYKKLVIRSSFGIINAARNSA